MGSTSAESGGRTTGEIWTAERRSKVRRLPFERADRCHEAFAGRPRRRDLPEGKGRRPRQDPVATPGHCCSVRVSERHDVGRGHGV